MNTIALAIASCMAVRAESKSRPRKEGARGPLNARVLDFVREQFKEGARLAADVLTAAQVVGISKSALDRARAALGVGTRRRGFGADAYYVWIAHPDLQVRGPRRRRRRRRKKKEQQTDGCTPPDPR